MEPVEQTPQAIVNELRDRLAAAMALGYNLAIGDEKLRVNKVCLHTGGKVTLTAKLPSGDHVEEFMLKPVDVRRKSGDCYSVRNGVDWLRIDFSA